MATLRDRLDEQWEKPTSKGVDWLGFEQFIRDAYRLREEGKFSDEQVLAFVGSALGAFTRRGSPAGVEDTDNSVAPRMEKVR